jgi:hypothetical protein
MYSLWVFKVYLWPQIFTSPYSTVPYIHLMPKYGHQPDFSLPPEDDPQILGCYILCDKLVQFNFGKFQHHPLEMNPPTILNVPTSRNPVDLSHVSVETRQLSHLYLSTNQKTFYSDTCRLWDGNVRECHQEWSAVLNVWSVPHSPRNQGCCFQINLCNSTL